MLLKACVNGPRTPGEHPALPVTPAEIAAAAAAAVAAGAGAVHVHPKDAAGADTLDPSVVAAVVSAVRAAAPGTPVGVTTGAWASTDRGAAVRGWTVLPDFASVNWHEPGSESLASDLLARGLGVEAGLWTPAAVAAWLAWPSRSRTLRVLLEVMGDASEAGPLVDALGPVDVPVLLHGEGAAAWPVLRDAGRRGLDTRIGLEDTLTLPDGTPAPDNAALVTAALALLGH
jgi:uncharacterized protein (DUF849 family)